MSIASPLDPRAKMDTKSPQYSEITCPSIKNNPIIYHLLISISFTTIEIIG